MDKAGKEKGGTKVVRQRACGGKERGIDIGRDLRAAASGKEGGRSLSS